MKTRKMQMKPTKFGTMNTISKCICVVAFLTTVTKSVLVEHNDHGVKRLCYEKICEPGFEAVICQFQHGHAQCRPCANGTFISGTRSTYEISENSKTKCQNHKSCNTSQTKLGKPGNSRVDNVCFCNNELGYHGAPSDCYRAQPCQPGFELLHNSDTGCTKCQTNYTKSNTGYEPCKPEYDAYNNSTVINCTEVNVECLSVGVETTTAANSTAGWIIFIAIVVSLAGVLFLMGFLAFAFVRLRRWYCRGGKPIGTSSESNRLVSEGRQSDIENGNGHGSSGTSSGNGHGGSGTSSGNGHGGSGTSSENAANSVDLPADGEDAELSQSSEHSQLTTNEDTSSNASSPRQDDESGNGSDPLPGTAVLCFSECDQTVDNGNTDSVEGPFLTAGELIKNKDSCDTSLRKSEHSRDHSSELSIVEQSWGTPGNCGLSTEES